MRCLHYTRKQTSVSYAADYDVIVCYGGAKPADKHLVSKIHCVDDEIIEWLKRVVSDALARARRSSAAKTNSPVSLRGSLRTGGWHF
jgi:hypothetical protein